METKHPDEIIAENFMESARQRLALSEAIAAFDACTAIMWEQGYHIGVTHGDDIGVFDNCIFTPATKKKYIDNIFGGVEPGTETETECYNEMN
jgi:hypothetical protein